jgi:hypothetical protein
MRRHLPNTDFDLLLSPRWGDSRAGLAVWLALAAVPLLLLFLLYSYELRLVRRLTATALLGLRLTVLALILGVVLLQPTLAPVGKEKVRPRVLLVVDRTGSMDAADPQRLPAEKLELARALRLHADLCTDLQADELIHDARTGKEPPDGERRRLHEMLCGRVDQMTRTETVRRLLADDGGGLLKRLRERADVELMGFADDVTEASPDSPDDLFAWPTAADEARTVARRDFTDLGLALDAAAKRGDGGPRPYRAVVLFSDGRRNRGRQPLDQADRLALRRTPLLPVLTAARQVRPSVVVTAVEAPPLVLKDAGDKAGVNVVVKARVRVRGVPPGTLLVDLVGNKGRLATRTLTHTGREEYDVVFPVELAEEGPHHLTVKVRPVAGVPESETVSRGAETAVVREKTEVLLIDGETRWEQHYLAAALGRDPQVQRLRGVVFEQPRLGRVPEGDLPKTWPALKMPPEPFALSDFDCVILGDALPEHLPLKDRRPGEDAPPLPRDDWDRLSFFVKERGGTLVIVAGKNAMPLGFLAAGPAGRPHPLAELLPVEEPRVVRSVGGFPLTLTDEGRLTPLLQLADKPEENDELLAGLPPHYWAVVGKKKPAATTLAFYPGEDEGRKLTREEQDRNALIAWHTVGKGRVLFVGLDSTWRWRYKTGDLYHHRFWGRVVRWATADKLLTAAAGPVRYGTPRTRYEPGEDVEVRVRIDSETKPLDEKDRAEAVLRRVEDGKPAVEVKRVKLEGRPGQPRVMGGVVRDLPSGTYEVTLDIPTLEKAMRGTADPGAPPPTPPRIVVTAPESAEQSDLSPDEEELRTLARRSGSGRVFLPQEADELVEQLTQERDEADGRRPILLWQWWPLLAVCVTLLTAEWACRKWAGLP